MSDEFTKHTIKKFGLRGSEVLEEEEKTTDLDDLGERIEQTAVSFCTCGAPITTTGGVYRCCNCEVLCCQHCHIELSRYNYCPVCIQQQYDLDKRTFLSLVFLKRGVMQPDDLIRVETDVDGTVVQVDIDAATGPVVEHDYLTDEGTLSAHGDEALHVGRQLYGDDTDVQGVMEQLRLQEVVARR